MPRLKLTSRSAVYHCISRVVGAERLLDDPAREILCSMLRKQARFTGLQVVTHCVLSNHFHILLRVPLPVPLSDPELIARATALYGTKSPFVKLLEDQHQAAGVLPTDLREGLLSRMGDISMFMKELKQRFSRWFNHQHDRFGTLWAERFKSLLVEDSPAAVEAVAVYVDLNPVRAAMTDDPAHYRWSGYGEAVGGNALAREGLGSFQENPDWAEAGRRYRELLLVTSGTAGSAEKVVLDPEELRKKLADGGKLSMGEVLRLRVRYFTDGVALGTRGYVEEVFKEFRDRFGSKRKTGARRMRGLGALGDLVTMRDLRKRPVG
jgi:hypothetical protein